MKKVSKNSRPVSVIPSRTSGAMDSVLDSCNSEADTSATSKLNLDKYQTNSLLHFLRCHSVTPDKQSKTRSGTNQASSDPFVHEHLSLYVRNRLLETKSKMILVSWVELLGISVEGVSFSGISSSAPKKVNFILHRDLVSSLPKASDNSPRFSSRELSKLEFSVSLFRNGSSKVDFRCDLASFQENPAYRYSLGRGLALQNPTDHTRFLLEFILFPVQELCRWMALEPKTYTVADPTDKSGVEVTLNDLVFLPRTVSRRDKEIIQPFFTKHDLTLNADLYCKALEYIGINSLSFTFQPNLSGQALNAVVGEDTTKDEVEKAANLMVRRLVALQSAIFNSRIWNENSSQGFDTMRVEETRQGISRMWKDDPFETLEVRSRSRESQAVKKVTLRATRPLTGESEYSIGFGTFDIKSIRRQFVRFGEYDSIIQSAQEPSTVPPMESLLSTLNQSIELTVTVHSRVLKNNYGVFTLADLRNRILTKHGGDTEKFSKQVIEKALKDTHIYYWNIPKRWSKLVFSKPEAFLLHLKSATLPDSFSPRGYEVSPEMQGLIDKIMKVNRVTNNEGLLESLKPLMVLTPRYVSKNRVMAVKDVPVISLFFLRLWYESRNVQFWDLLHDSKLVPSKWLHALNTPSRSKERTAMNLLIKEVRAFLLDNLNIDISYSRQLHAEVARKSAEVMSSSVSHSSSMDEDETFPVDDIRIPTPLKENTLTRHNINNFFFRDLQRGTFSDLVKG